MATIKEFKAEIAKLAKKQKDCKQSNSQWEQYMNRGILHAMYTAYYILRHDTCAKDYIQQTLDRWIHKNDQGWRSYVWLNLESRFTDTVMDYTIKYGETICTDKQEA